MKRSTSIRNSAPLVLFFFLCLLSCSEEEPVVDNTLPEITLLKPIESVVFNTLDTIWIEVEAFDEFGVEEIVLYIDGQPIHSCNSERCTFGFAPFEEGEYTVYVTVRDVNWNIIVSESRKFFINLDILTEIQIGADLDEDATYFSEYLLPISVEYTSIPDQFRSIKVFNGEEQLLETDSLLNSCKVRLHEKNSIYVVLELEDGQNIVSNIYEFPGKRFRSICSFSTYYYELYGFHGFEDNMIQGKDGRLLVFSRSPLTGEGIVTAFSPDARLIKTYPVYTSNPNAIIELSDGAYALSLEDHLTDECETRIYSSDFRYFNTWIHPYEIGTGLLEISPGKVLTSGRQRSNSGKSYLQLINNTTNEVFTTTYPSFLINHLEKHEDGFLLGTSGYEYLRKVDTLYNTLWSTFSQKGEEHILDLCVLKNLKTVVYSHDEGIIIVDPQGKRLVGIDIVSQFLAGYRVSYSRQIKLLPSEDEFYVIVTNPYSAEDWVLEKVHFILKFNEYGSLLWQRKYYGADGPFAALITKDLGMQIVGFLGGEDEGEFISHRVSSDGEFYW